MNINYSFVQKSFLLCLVIIVALYLTFPFLPNWNTIRSGKPFSIKLENCPVKTIVTVNMGGQLGNVIWEYLSIVAVAKRYQNLKAFTPNSMKNKLETVFDSINTTEITEIAEYCRRSEDRQLTVRVSAKITPHILINRTAIVLAMYSARFEEILSHGVNFIRDELQFKSKFVEKATDYLNEIRIAKGFIKDNVVFVGVHYRGGDYVRDLKATYNKDTQDLPDYRYYQLAMSYYRSLYEKIIFIFITVDEEWLLKNVPFFLDATDVHVKRISSSKESAFEDLAILAHCNHSIINYGTYSTTAALYAAGQAIVYDLDLKIDYRGYTLALGIARTLPNWHLCNNTHCDIRSDIF